MEDIREARSEDLQDIYELINELEDTRMDEELFRKVFLGNLSDPNVHYYVYEKNSIVVGFISVHVQTLLHHIGKIGEIQELIVAGNVRGEGIGRQLFNKAKEICKAYGCLQLEVSCNQKREDSHRFYQSQGMKSSHYKFCCTL